MSGGSVYCSRAAVTLVKVVASAAVVTMATAKWMTINGQVGGEEIMDETKVCLLEIVVLGGS
jgi:hypothetical protein